MSRSATALATKTINAKKRKSTDGIDVGKGASERTDKRRRTLDTFFLPQVAVKSTVERGENATCEHVSLNQEQVRVLQMVVQEEKNVFFTGAAGESTSFH
ncbi:hypothetical protein C8Q79DRAFT_348391 [Trametes meyenii]|nr:hypothetical protein C8Q79DRAFT_348391 [Trametes meyenii]